MIVVCLLLISTGACSKMIMPYKSDYGCPNKDSGMCASVDVVHQDVRKTELSTPQTLRSIDGIYESNSTDSEEFSLLMNKYQKAITKEDKDEIARLAVVINEKYRGSIKVGELRKKIEMDMSKAASQHQVVQKLVEGSRKNGPQRTDAVKMQVTVIPYETQSGYYADARHMWVIVEESSWVVDKAKIDLKESSTLGKLSE